MWVCIEPEAERLYNHLSLSLTGVLGFVKAGKAETAWLCWTSFVVYPSGIKLLGEKSVLQRGISKQILYI